MFLSQFIRGACDLLAPHTCAACGSPLDEHPQPARNGPRTPLRGQGAIESQSGFCHACEPLIEPAPPGDLDDAACEYGGPLADAITHFKYGGRSDLARPLALRLAPRAAPFAHAVDLVCCVPLHRARFIERGYNQSALLAAHVARALGLRFCPALLERIRSTPSQAGLGRPARLTNVQGAFRTVRLVRSLRVLVVDDVATTYATLTEVRRTLDMAGAAEVRTLVLARAARSLKE